MRCYRGWQGYCKVTQYKSLLTIVTSTIHKEEYHDPWIDSLVAWGTTCRRRAVIHLPCHLEEEVKGERV